MKRSDGIWLALLGTCLILLLTWVSAGDWDGRVALSFALALGLAGGGLAWLQRRLPHRVWLLMVAAAVLRLALGAFWVVALPRWGYGNPAERAGYVMADAFERDTAAWRLAQSGEPLWVAFRGYHHSDQYGGMLFLSATVYRYLDLADRHLPLLVVVFAAAASATAVALGWALGRRWGGATAGWLVAWGLALYPEAVLLGSTQMREAFTLPLAGAALLALAVWEEQASQPAALALVGALAAMAVFTPPMAAITALMLGLVLLLGVQTPWSRRQMWTFAAVGTVALGLGLASAWLLTSGHGGGLRAVRWWLHEVFRYQAYLAERASGWMQVIFRSTPDWFHAPFLMVYGLLQPFLPAALVASGAPLWKGIAIARALGWSLLLVGLVYAPLTACRVERRRLLLVFWMVVVIGALLADYRGAADQWDNPRYRATWAVWQWVLLAWLVVVYRKHRDPWLPRLLGGLGSGALWLLFWYLGRYTPLPWPVHDLFKTVSLGLLTGLLFILWHWVGDSR